MTIDQVRITSAVAIVLRAFLDDVGRPRYGYDLIQTTKFGSSKLYPILARLHAAGWLTRQREDIDPTVAGRPVRYWYQLTSEGQVLARLAVAELHQRLAPAPRPAAFGRPGNEPA